MLQWYFILFFSRDHVLTMLHLAPIFCGGKLGILGGGGGVYPSNTLDRTLSPRLTLSTVRKVSVLVENDNRKDLGTRLRCLRSSVQNDAKFHMFHGSKNSKNTTRWTTFAIWRISVKLNIPLSPELAEKQATEDRTLTWIEVNLFWLFFFFFFFLTSNHFGRIIKQ